MRYRLHGDGEFSEQELEGELLAILKEIDPALDSLTGRLLPGRRNAEIRTNLFLTEPDGEGLAHLGGIECAEADAAALEVIATKMGYRVSSRG